MKNCLTILFAITLTVSAFGQADTSKYAIFSFQDYSQHPFADKGLFLNSRSTDLTQNDIIEIDILLKQCVANYNTEQKNKNLKNTINMTPYIRQCVAVINNNSEKEVWINCYWLPDTGPYVDWKKQLIIIPDSGFNLIINLTTKKYYDLKIKGKG